MRVLITGGAGFIGSHLAERLLKEGHGVVALDDLSTGTRDNLRRCETHADFTFHEGTILDAALVRALCSEADFIVHLAAAVGVKLIMEESSRSILTNVTGTENVLGAARDLGRPVFVASTSEVYGKASKFPFSEEDDLTIGATTNLRWSYASAKTLDEFLTLAYVREDGLKGVVLRFFNTTGPRQTGRYGMVLPNFVTAALAGTPITVHGTGEQSRCFGHVADAVEAMIRLMNTPAAFGQVFNVGNDEEVTIGRLAELVRDAAGSSSEIIRVPYSQVYAQGFEDMMRRVPDVSKLERVTGYRPRTPLTQIIDDIIREKRACLGL